MANNLDCFNGRSFSYGRLAASVGGVGAGLVAWWFLVCSLSWWFSAGIYLAVLVVVAGLYYLRAAKMSLAGTLSCCISQWLQCYGWRIAREILQWQAWAKRASR